MLLSLACEDERENRKQTIKPALLRTFYSRYSQSVDHSQTHTHTRVLAHTLCDTEASPAQGHGAKALKEKQAWNVPFTARMGGKAVSVLLST